MSGSRLGRGRGGRLAIYTGCLLIVVLLVMLYRAATTEMTRLRELHDQCTHQQEALAAQLQVIFEYKVRLEKSLAEEKSSNTAIKEELQQRATREKSLRDKDSIESMQKYNSLQQQFKLLKTEHQDLKDECATTQKLAYEDKNRLETKLQDLRIQISDNKKMNETIERLKTKYLEIEVEKTKIENKYNDLLKNSGNADSRVEHLNKQVFQLKQDLKDAKTSCRSTPSSQIFEKSQTSHQIAQPVIDQQIASSSSSRQQVSRPHNDNENPQPLQPPRDHQPIDGNPSDNAEEVVDEIFNKQNESPVFELVGDNMVPGDPNKNDNNNNNKKLPLPYTKKNINDNKKKTNNQGEAPKSIIQMDHEIDDQAKQVLPMPIINNPKKYENNKNTNVLTNNIIPILKTKINETVVKDHPDEQIRNIESPLNNNNNLNDLQKKTTIKLIN